MNWTSVIFFCQTLVPTFDINLLLLFSCLVVSNSLQPHGLQHTRSPCPSPSLGACSNPCPKFFAENFPSLLPDHVIHVAAILSLKDGEESRPAQRVPAFPGTDIVLDLGG